MTSANQHVTVPAGRKGALALRDVIGRCKGDDLLAPVTVVVPSTLAGLSLRRLLASGGLDEPGDPVTGIANVGFTVVGRLLELLGAPTLTAEGRRRMDPAVRAEAVRAELLAEPGLFGPVARHPATERRLDATFTELRRADAPAIERLAQQSHRSAEIVRLLHAVEARLHGWFDDQDLLEPALATVRAGGQAVAELGHLVLYAGRSDDTEARALVEAFGDRGTVIDTTTDPAPVGTAVVSASDADDEVRRAVREVLRLVDAGTPLHRIAIAHPGAAYPLLIHQQLASAGIPHNGQGVQTLAQTAAGRALLGAFALVDHDFRRDDVLGWLASAPLLQSDGRWVPLARWDRLSRRAGVVGGVEQWTKRLSAKHLELTEAAAAIADDPEQAARADRKHRDAESIGRLRDFVVRLGDELTATDRDTWADHVQWASRLLLELIGTDAQRSAWPEAELKAADRVLDTLAGLASLDELGTPVDLPTFRRAVERDLDVPAARLGPFGDGVLVSSLRPLRGVDLDAVVVVGLAEGLAPMRSREDAMVPDRERTAAGESLRRPNRVLEQHEDLLAVLAAARGPRILCFPRADLASGRHHLPSWWLLDTASALARTRVYSDDLGDLAATVASIEEVPSFTAGLREEPAVSLLDRDLGRLLEWQEGGGRAIDHPLASEEPAFGVGLHAIDERDSERFTAFDGNVDPAAVPQLAPDRPLSPTSLESYAACPRRYFFSRVLGLQEDERPEDLEQIAPAARGTLVHAVLEDYTRGLLAGQPRSIDRLLDIADDKFTEAEAQGLTGRPLRWEWDQTVIEADLLRIHDEDVLEPVAAELAFGVGDEPPVEVVLDDGRRLTFKGYADRVDRGPDGTIVVTDYKTGSARHFKDLDKTFVDRGRKLQLPIYGLAARDRFGGEGQPVRSQYWFVSGRGGFQKIGYDLDEGLPMFLDTVEVIADGIADGVFPASPGDVVDWPTPSWESCRYCEFNRICPSNRGEEWVRKREAPELRAYVSLAEPPEADEAEGVGTGSEPPGPAAANERGAAGMTPLTTSDAPPTDQADRDAVRSDLGRTLFVEAGAGTGKTTALVGRIVTLVRQEVPLREVAAITFTEAAAAELRDRVRTRLQQAAVAGEVPPACADEVDDAAISTLHAFAQRIISEHPLEAGLPPAIEVLDEISSGLEFDERWRRFIDGLYADPTARDVLLRSFALGLDLDRLREVALRFEDQRDRLPLTVPEPTPPEPVDVAPVVAALRQAADWRSSCVDPSDPLYERLGQEAHIADLLAAADTDVARIELLVAHEDTPLQWAPRDKRKGPQGRKKSWSDECAGVRIDHQAAKDAYQSTMATIRRGVLSRLVDRVHQFTLDAAAERMADGRLAFHDLLIAARDLLRTHPEVRRAEHDHYRYLLIDEFQDTDPIQVELAILLATGVDDVGDEPWHQLPVDSGRVFFVGDPKQSIYRFRRADIDLFLDVQSKAADEVLHLLANFRSVPDVVDWVNVVFGELMPAQQKRGQAAYQALVPHRPPMDGVDSAVTVIGHEHEARVGEIREIEAGEIAAVLRQAWRRWPVSVATPDGEATRVARWQDMAVLLPTRTSLPMLEKALAAADVPYRVESASLVWSTQQVRELLAVLRAIDDPSDEVAVVAALRSPSFACSDDDLLSYRVGGGRWVPTSHVPEGVDERHPVAQALAELRELHDDRWWPGVSGMVEHVLRRLRFFELATAGPRPRDPWRRLRFVLQQAREFEATPGATLRRFLDWADAQASEAARVREPVLPESDDDAVRILTVHGAKGLEFPMVVLTGLNRGRDNRLSTVLWDDDQVAQVRIARFESDGFDEVSDLSRELDQEERLRLLYVAATRACDHLVLSVHRPARKENDARLLVEAMETSGAVHGRLDPWAGGEPITDTGTGSGDAAEPVPLPLPPPVAPEDQPGARTAWVAERERLLESRRRLVSRVATSLQTADEEKAEPDVDTHVHRLGRAGSAVGRAVHATLQAVDLASPADVTAIAAAEAAAEHIAELAGQVEGSVRNALASDVVAEAVRHRHWREMYVGAPTTNGMIEGFIDLLYERPDGLVIVDYKTDRAPEPDGMAAAVARYRLQLATYALALEQTLGRPVAGAALLFVSGREARTRWIEDLPAAVQEVSELLMSPPT